MAATAVTTFLRRVDSSVGKEDSAVDDVGEVKGAKDDKGDAAIGNDDEDEKRSSTEAESPPVLLPCKVVLKGLLRTTWPNAAGGIASETASDDEGDDESPALPPSVAASKKKRGACLVVLVVVRPADEDPCRRTTWKPSTATRRPATASSPNVISLSSCLIIDQSEGKVKVKVLIEVRNRRGRSNEPGGLGLGTAAKLRATRFNNLDDTAASDVSEERKTKPCGPPGDVSSMFRRK
jgi:hypothetical protein